MPTLSGITNSHVGEQFSGKTMRKEDPIEFESRPNSDHFLCYFCSIEGLNIVNIILKYIKIITVS